MEGFFFWPTLLSSASFIIMFRLVLGSSCNSSMVSMMPAISVNVIVDWLLMGISYVVRCYLCCFLFCYPKPRLW